MASTSLSIVAVSAPSWWYSANNGPWEIWWSAWLGDTSVRSCIIHRIRRDGENDGDASAESPTLVANGPICGVGSDITSFVVWSELSVDSICPAGDEPSGFVLSAVPEELSGTSLTRSSRRKCRFWCLVLMSSRVNSAVHPGTSQRKRPSLV
ncbi:hypothetical protein OGATHE_004177 [Ogataea polymorpha]|uniref:Uncharacterized protein n=1 Tax=Ogataea polymorpha TaxID=460523 RepID=A0A9P8T4Y4_9ASCO|nr:hypothetical protein OGATHE_004177 [Ogataea polymorpha]